MMPIEQELRMKEFAENFIAKNKSYYRLHTNNCADFVYEILTSQLPPISESVYIPYDLIDRLERGYNQNGITTWKFNWVISLLKFFNQVP